MRSFCNDHCKRVGLLHLGTTTRKGADTKTDAILSYVTDKEFSKMLLENGFFPGRIVAASDPDVDLERVKERFAGELK